MICHLTNLLNLSIKKTSYGMSFQLFLLCTSNGTSLGMITFCTHNMDGLVQKDVTPLLMHWSYAFLALTQQYITLFIM